MLRTLKYSSVIIAAVLGIILSITQIYDWFKEASSDLTAEIHYGYWVPEKDLVLLLNKYITLVDTNEMIERIDVNGLRKYMDEEILIKTVDLLKPEFEKYLYREIPSYLLSIGRTAEGYWSVEVKNDTNQEISKVLLCLPYTCSAFIRTESGQKEFFESDGRISLGTLQPQEVAYVFAWTTARPDLFEKSQIKLTHSNGIGKLVLYEPVGPLGQFCDKYWVLLIFIGVSLIYFSVYAGYFFCSYEKKNSIGKKEIKKFDNSKTES